MQCQMDDNVQRQAMILISTSKVYAMISWAKFQNMKLGEMLHFR